ncbi:MAG: hypothetical protein A3F09_05285 [Chlamydiae bacterium RIFCSPHIGHO2_12_FULL_49_11]|nr:MAG: hypothetical protein A3F09_05285 [Chlamydiae bacterium RIFCSPHIGHO2_12_FULL_49_11]
MGKVLLRGFIGIAPIAITILLVVWLFNELEWLFGTPIKAVFGDRFYFKGLGVIIAMIVLFFVGLILNSWVIQHLYNWFEVQLKKIPLLKTIYTSVTDLMSFFHKGENQEKGKVVMVNLNGMRFLGLVARENFDDLPKGVGNSNEELAVFLPFSYQIGGFTAIVPRSSVSPVDFSVERGLRFAVTAGSRTGDRPTYSPPPKRKNKKS